MDKLQKLSLVSSLRVFIRRMKTGNMNPDLAWRIILMVSLTVSLVIGVGAYFALNWAQSIDQEPLVSKKDRDALSPEDLHSIVQIYEVKENTYKNLHQSRPIAPNPKMGSKTQNENMDSGIATTTQNISGGNI